MMFIQEYGLGRDIAPRLHWSAIYRSDEWLIGHFRNPAAYTARSIMPVMPFNDSKFYVLTKMLRSIAKENLDTFTSTPPHTKKKKTTGATNELIPIDLTTHDDSIDNDTSTKSLASILLDEKDKKLVQVKREQEETRATLDDLREDLEIANETITHQMVFTDAWQSKFDDLKALAEAAGVDGAAIAAIKDR